MESSRECWLCCGVHADPFRSSSLSLLTAPGRDGEGGGRGTSAMQWAWFLLQELILSARSTGEMKHPPEGREGQGRIWGKRYLEWGNMSCLTKSFTQSDFSRISWTYNLPQWGIPHSVGNLPLQEEFLIQHQNSSWLVAFHFPSIFPCAEAEGEQDDSQCAETHHRSPGSCGLWNQTPHCGTATGPIQETGMILAALPEALPAGILTSVWSWGSAECTSALCSMMWSRYSVR